MDAASSTKERENRWRLEQIVHACELVLQQRTQQAWASRDVAATAKWAKTQRPIQRNLLTKSPIDIGAWDITLCNAVLMQVNALTQKGERTAVNAVVEARNCCAHAAGGRMTTSLYEKHATKCLGALTTLGGDAAAVQQRMREVDTSDVSIIACSREATKAAEQEKLGGNRMFGEGDFHGARECYTRGLQIAGAVEPMVLAQLHNNRATASFRLNEFKFAKEDARHAIELAPQWAKPYVRLAEIYYATYKHDKATARMEIALGMATAAQDTVIQKEVIAKLADYRLQRDKAMRCESENLAYGPMHATQAHVQAAARASQGLTDTQDPMAIFNKLTSLDMSECTMLQAKKHVMLGQLAMHDGRQADAAREYMAAALAGDPEGMYNYAICQLNGRGTRKTVGGAVHWLEKAASMATTDSFPVNDKFKNVGVGEAIATLGNLYNSGIHFVKDETRAREYWEQSAALGVNAGLNNFALCLMNATHGVKKDLPRARDLFRRSAELLHNEAMSNLAALHASLLEYETAARWADSAFNFGFIPAKSVAAEYRKMAAKLASMPPKDWDMITRMAAALPRNMPLPDSARRNSTPTLDELRAIGTPYGKRLLGAKQLMGEAMSAFHSRDPRQSPQAMAALAAQAYRVDDSVLVFSQEELRDSTALALVLRAGGIPLNPDLALLSKPTEAFDAIAFWKSMQLQFPDDLAITKRAACMYLFTKYPGANVNRGVELFQRAFSLLPCPNDDSDPHTLDLLYLAGVAYSQTGERGDMKRAESLLARFLKYAAADGHRKGPNAHYLLGTIAMGNAEEYSSLTRNVMEKHFREGELLRERMPPFLRVDADEFPHRDLLVRVLNFAGCHGNPKSRTLPASPSRRRGGELLNGLRRHIDLRSDSPVLQSMWRAKIATMAAMACGNSKTTYTSWSTPPSRQSTRANRSTTSSVATIDELFSALKDRVCTGRHLNCIVVSLPSFNGSSFMFVVEDSQREPARIAVYKPPSSLIRQLVPGRAFQLLNPYVRIAHDHSIMLRVDDPTAMIVIETLHTICWVCSVEQGDHESLKRCAKCHKATYCSKQCQTQDWSVDGHRFLCRELRLAA